ncbi:GIY-YIG nuclease family protein [Gordonia sp. 4N]|uniref:GIY-YIG nuclease family protein n=1 Tax=Gordonia sp. 4N TaxID=2993508 RepID=UPI0022498139|nr:GIY-YIG nuclease family protein [Gordonia sp. 4N]MCX2755528.1 GIY-YIG nuclease family protein [Gordonia sp. 4N]
MPGFLYILECADGTLYVGSTRNVEHRLDQHQSGNGSRYTRTRRPVRLVFRQEFPHIGEAHAAERRLHGWSRAKRTALIEGRLDLLPELSRSDP